MWTRLKRCLFVLASVLAAEVNYEYCSSNTWSLRCSGTWTTRGALAASPLTQSRLRGSAVEVRRSCTRVGDGKSDDESMGASISRSTLALYRKFGEVYDKTRYDKLMES